MGGKEMEQERMESTFSLLGVSSSEYLEDDDDPSIS